MSLSTAHRDVIRSLAEQARAADCDVGLDWRLVLALLDALAAATADAAVVLGDRVVAVHYAAADLRWEVAVGAHGTVPWVVGWVEGGRLRPYRGFTAEAAVEAAALDALRALGRVTASAVAEVAP